MKFLCRSCELFLLDLSHVSEAQYAKVQGVAGRSPQDFVGEVVGFNQLVIESLRTGRFPRPDAEARAALVARLSTIPVAADAFRESVDVLVEEFGKASDEELTKRVVAPWGERLSLLELVHDTAVHINYHGAQLTYVQALHGDGVNHWRD